ncbi:beta-ketoacyl-ACP synthase III [Ectothiorhodospiraceae bacterium WFHF3C12]|nr:beta-ketoacyl-ACP synthase III [Ectothiorhodospiraceae bacterium WFHF3C12]
MTNPVYIRRLAAFLPGEPIDNERMESLLGQIDQRPSRARRLVLRNNGITTRYYALDPATGRPTHNNAQLTAEAVHLLADAGLDLDQLDVLACGTSSPDQLMPNHAVMVHGELGNPPCEVSSSAGVCVAGVTALKYAAMTIALGTARTAVATGSEIASTFMQGKYFRGENDARVAAMEQNPEIAFEKDFLRWMLSDGAGAVWLSPDPGDGLALRLDWIEQRSFANELPACMYAGARKREDGTLEGWREVGSMQEVVDDSLFAVKQDVRLLNEHIVEYTVERMLPYVRARHPLHPADVDWFLPHYSSRYFRDRLAAGLRRADFEIPQERWFTNLPWVGNVGSASIYLMLEELQRSGRLQPGQTVLCHVPESGRFSSAFMQLTAVTP